MTTCEALADVPRHRRRGDVEGDAGDDRGRPGRARADPRRRPALRVEAAVGAAASARARRRTTRSAPRSARRGGSLGPVGFEGEVVADLTLQEGQFVAGANQDGFHLRGVEAGRDYEPRFADLREPIEGDRCPECGGALTFQTTIEVGHIFYFADKYSAGLEATFLDEDGTEKPLLGGSYGIGPGRVLAAIVEQSHDENGIIWPDAIAPYNIHLVALKGAEEIAEQAAERLSAAGYDVLLDDRDQRPGEKFADADLIGIPVRVTAGKKSLEDGAVDVRDRRTGEERRVSVDSLGKDA